jgi:hypothetical protein
VRAFRGLSEALHEGVGEDGVVVAWGESRGRWRLARRGLLVTDTQAGRRMALRMGPTTWGRCGSGTGGALIWSGQDGV